MIGAIVFMLIIFFGFCVGVWCGQSHCKSRRNPTHAGNIVINTTNPTKDTIRIELEIPITTMMGKDELSFNVVNEDVS